MRALHIREKCLAAFHLDTASTLLALASICDKQGNQEQAEAMLHCAGAIFEYYPDPVPSEAASARRLYYDLRERIGKSCG